MQHGGTPSHDPLLVAILFQGMIIPVALLLAWLLGVSPWSGLTPDLASITLGLAATLPPLIALHGLTRARVRWFEELSDMIRPLIHSLFRGRWPGWIVVVSLLAGFGEELLFRGVLQGWLAGFSPPWLAVVAASLVFGLLHFLSWTYFLFAVGFGLYLGVIYQVTDSLLAVCLVHALYDWMAIRMILREPSPPPATSGGK